MQSLGKTSVAISPVITNRSSKKKWRRGWNLDKLVNLREQVEVENKKNNDSFSLSCYPMNR